ncbi:unnamed protein product [Lota lota]
MTSSTNPTAGCRCIGVPFSLIQQLHAALWRANAGPSTVRSVTSFLPSTAGVNALLEYSDARRFEALKSLISQPSRARTTLSNPVRLLPANGPTSPASTLRGKCGNGCLLSL